MVFGRVLASPNRSILSEPFDPTSINFSNGKRIEDIRPVGEAAMTDPTVLYHVWEVLVLKQICKRLRPGLVEDVADTERTRGASMRASNCRERQEDGDTKQLTEKAWRRIPFSQMLTATKHLPDRD